MIKMLILSLILGITVPSSAQQITDTVIVELANTSKVVFTMRDRNDVTLLRQYDFQALFTDIINKFDDSTQVQQADTSIASVEMSSEDETKVQDDHAHHHWDKKVRNWKTFQSVNFDFGVNNYLHNGKFPDEDNELYTVRPWGSWYVGINSTQHTKISGPLFLDWSFGISWYNFKFQKDNIVISKNDSGLIFTEDLRDENFIKSKLTASYINASFIPMLDFGGRDYKSKFWNSNDHGFRIGAGPYAGYRIGSHSKLVYEREDNEKEIERNNFYLNNLRYGIRFQIGFGSTDFFFNYDLNELFTSKPDNPELNAFSFGVTF